MDYITKNSSGFIVYQGSSRSKWFKIKTDAVAYRDKSRLPSDWFQNNYTQKYIKAKWNALSRDECKNLKLCKKNGKIVSVKYEQMIYGEIKTKQFSFRRYGFEKAIRLAQELRR